MERIDAHLATERLAEIARGDATPCHTTTVQEVNNVPRPYAITIHPKAQKELAKLRRQDRTSYQRIDGAITALRTNPRPGKCKKLSRVLPQDSVYRLSVTYRFRVIYQVADTNLEILVIEAGDREDVNYHRLGGRLH